MVILLKMFRNISHFKFRNKLLFAVNKTNGFQRNIHSCSRLNVKMFMEFENKYAYNIMNNKGYAVSLNFAKAWTSLKKDQFELLMRSNWSEVSPQEMFSIFPKLGVYCTENNLCISENIFDQYIDYLTDNIKCATDQELTSLFYSVKQWPDTPSIRTRNYIELWVALDDECLKRMPNWSYDEMLSYLALFFMLNVSRVSDFCNKSLQRLASKAKHLTPAQIVQTMFFISIFRKAPFDMHNLEVFIENHFTEFSIDELAIISMGFFKAKTPIRSMTLISSIIGKVIENSKDIHEVSLAALLKVIRYSKKINNDSSVYDLLDVIQHEVPRLSLMSNVHMALVGTSTMTYHEGCLSKIADFLNSRISQARLKDLERLVLSYGTFNFKPKTQECLFTKVMNELRKTERTIEIEKHGRSFICCVGYLGLLEFYPFDLINKALCPELLEKTYGKQSYAYGREVLVVNNLAKLFCKGEINMLSSKDVNILAKKYTDYVPCENYTKQYNVTERMFLDVKKILIESRGGAQYVNGTHILSHHQRGDLIICNDENGNPLPVNEMFKDKKYGVIYPPPDDNKWIVLVIAGRNSMIYKFDTPTGNYQAKVRELNALGFRGALVLWNIYSRCKSKEEKLDYINHLIDEVTKK
ncbi:FAST kinase domain-containing protein 5, mitochondrial [Epargyreus clarus]|uniref:FAST kinase domain-containing protein 5, mitochondrial n=1 Tax=Epargyreus clarus TaxID=520877 RepID=UPI003C2DECCB